MPDSLLEQVMLGQAPALMPLTTDQYHQMLVQGILADGSPVELIDGLLVCKDRSVAGGDGLSHDPEHATSVRRLQRLDVRLPTDTCFVQLQLPITVPPHHTPEPDAAIVRGTEHRFTQGHPGAEDLLAVMEVSHSSLRFDRTTKQRLYAAANIPVYWIVNLPDKQIEVYEDPDPSSGKYRRRTDFRAGQTVPLSIDGDLTIDVEVATILP